MSSPVRIVRNLSIGLAALIAVVIGAALVAIHTQWFRDFARETLVAEIEEDTGGRVEIGTFYFDASSLHAHIGNLVIHGNEPAGSAPFLRVAAIDLQGHFLRAGHIVDISYLGIDRPQVNVLISADGTTNIPTPKPKPPSKTTPLETVVDLAIGRFELRNGQLSLNSLKQPLDVQANHLHAQLWYHLLQRNYQGLLSLEPIYVVSGRNTPVTLRLTLPVVLERDRIRLHDAHIATAHSAIQIDGSMENLRQPKISAHVRGNVAVSDLQTSAGLPVQKTRRGLPDTLKLDVNASASNDRIRASSMNITLGNSTLTASGTLQDPRGQESLQFEGDLALAELAGLAAVSARPSGSLLLKGEAKLDANNRYQISSHFSSRNLSFDQGTLHIHHVELSTDVRANPDRIELNRIRLAAFGGEFGGDATVQNLQQCQLKGNLRHLDIQQALAVMREKIPYSGVISGSVQANGDLKAKGTQGLDARADLAIVPGRQGIPVQGRLRAAYNGTRDDIKLDDSYLTLPHTHLTLDGSLQRGLEVSLTTRDLHDLLAAAPTTMPPPITLNGGRATFTGAVTGAIRAPRIAGHLAVNRFQLEGRAFDSVGADVAASSSGVAVNDGYLARGAMKASFGGTVGLRACSPVPVEPVSANAAIVNGDLADVMALAGQPNRDFSGALSANLHVAGTVGNPSGSADLHVANGTLDGQPFDRFDGQARMTDQVATIPSATWIAGTGRADLTAEFQHPRGSFETGRIHAHLTTNSIDLASIRPLERQARDTSGQAQVTVDATGNLSPSELLLTNIQADASARALRFQGQSYGDLQLQARTSGQTATLTATSNFAGSSITVRGSTQLVSGYPTTAEANIANLPIERALTVARRSDIPASGKLSATAHLRGTLQNPEGDATLDLASANIYNEPINRAHARITYLAQSIDVQEFQLTSGPSRIALSARFDHPAGSFDSGNLQIRVDNSRIDLARVRNVQLKSPGLAGSLQLSADAAAAVRSASPRVLLTSLNASVAGSQLTDNGKDLGALSLSAHTAGSQLNVTLTSNLAGSSIQANGNAQLAANYPVNAQLTFGNVRWSRLAPILGQSTGGPAEFEALTEGSVSLNGPALDVDHLRGSLQMSRLELTTTPPAGTINSITIRNQGPIAASLNNGAVRLDSFHLTGPRTDIQASGTLTTATEAVSANVNAGVDLGVLENFSRDLTSSGKVNLMATLRGTLSDPQANGKLELHDASAHYASMPNGLSHANGVVLLQGNRASIQNLTAESGGGKITLSGFTTLGASLRFSLLANATNIRIRVEPGVSLVASANIRMAGSESNSTCSGTVTLEQLNYAARNDLGSLLERAAPPVQNPATPSPLLDNMKLDIRIRSSSAMSVQTSLAENLQTDANLHVTGSASQPSVLGRIDLTEGKLVFFGSTYTINTGTISFYNPVRIEPNLNVSLETQSQGVDVVLNVTGPLENMKLTYTSDPPLQFQEIVSLLAAGTTPTSDPTILANQPTPPPQSFEQMGESAIVGQAVANPVASRLQRVFGVSQLKINPTFAGSSQLPTAQITLQQKVSTNITFTYVTAIDDPNSTLIQAEWALNQRWSAMAVRDQNGIFSVNLLYKKEFR